MVIDCPNCGANVSHDGRAEHVRCPFCATQFLIPMRASRTELEMERDQILAREQEDKEQAWSAKKRGIEDFLYPPIGCCGIYFGLFIVGSLLIGALGLKGSEPAGLLVATIAIAAAAIGAVLIVVRRETRRRERVVRLEYEWTTDRELRQRRLREIEAELEALDE